MDFVCAFTSGNRPSHTCRVDPLALHNKIVGYVSELLPQASILSQFLVTCQCSPAVTPLGCCIFVVAPQLTSLGSCTSSIICAFLLAQYRDNLIHFSTMLDVKSCTVHCIRLVRRVVGVLRDKRHRGNWAPICLLSTF